jgi:hypothetical protein
MVEGGTCAGKHTPLPCVTVIADLGRAAGIEHGHMCLLANTPWY